MWEEDRRGVGRDMDVLATAAALNYVECCVKMKGPWFRKNTMTCRVEYLYMKKSKLETFEHARERYSKGVKL
eukprot:1805883-Alexandrium_andersonii.AAC.1